MPQFDEIAINTELVLVSLIEGVALTNLAEHAVPLMNSPQVFQYLPYILAGLALLLAFWAQSVLHAISFIRWPIRVEHMFLYFVAAFLQIVAYSAIENLTMWFFWWTIFTLLAFVMYVVDLRIIRESRSSFSETDAARAYIADVEKRHLYEMKYLLPTALVFNIGAMLAVTLWPTLFANPLIFIIPGTLQLLISIGALFDCAKNFQLRSMKVKEVFTA